LDELIRGQSLAGEPLFSLLARRLGAGPHPRTTCRPVKTALRLLLHPLDLAPADLVKYSKVRDFLVGRREGEGAGAPWQTKPRLSPPLLLLRLHHVRGGSSRFRVNPVDEVAAENAPAL